VSQRRSQSHCGTPQASSAEPQGGGGGSRDAALPPAARPWAAMAGCCDDMAHGCRSMQQAESALPPGARERRLGVFRGWILRHPSIDPAGLVGTVPLYSCTCTGNA
jgi:hypothetical protein